MSSPLILVNLKTFKEGMGNRGHMIANAAQLVAHESGVTIAIAPSYVDLHPLCHHFAIPVYAQHVDGFEPGAHTGHITADAIRMAGVQDPLSTIQRDAWDLLRLKHQSGLYRRKTYFRCLFEQRIHQRRCSSTCTGICSD